MKILSLLLWLLLITEHHGRVTIDGVPVPGATVTFSKGDQKLTTVTDGAGAYAVPDLPDGVWTIQVEMLGFAPAKQDITVGAGAPEAQWELKMLAMDEIHAEIVKSAPAASASAPASTPAAGAAAGRAQAGFQRANVQETARPAGATVAPANNAQAQSAFANVSQEDLSQRANDGLLINGSVNNGAASPFAQSARIGNNTPGRRSLYNGNFNFPIDTSRLDAQTYSLTGQQTPKPDFTKRSGSFSFGGPLRFGKFFRNNYPTFFVGYSRTQNRDGNTSTGRMPTDLERTGDFSQTLVPTYDLSTGTTVNQPVRIFDPTTGQPFFNSVIPSGAISPQARYLLSMYPKPNFTGSAAYNYQVPLTGTSHSDGFQSRITKSFNNKHAVNGTFSMQSARSESPSIFNFTDNSRSKAFNVGVNWNYRPSPRLTQTFQFGLSRQTSHSLPYFANLIDVGGNAGISGNNRDAPYWGPPNLGFSTGYSGLNDGQYSFNRALNYNFGYSGFWNHGRHNLNWGADFRRTLLNNLSQSDARGTFTFTGAVTRSATDPTTGYDFADFLLGMPDTSSIAFGNADKYFRQSSYDGYVSDDWKVSGPLTLNVGARWEYEAPVTERFGRLVNLNVAPGFTQVTPVTAQDPHGAVTGTASGVQYARNAGYPQSLVNPDKWWIQPRLAFAWRPIAASSLIVRGGYGVYRNTGVYQAIANQMAQQPPLSKTLSVSNSTCPLTMASGFPTNCSTTPNTFAINPNFRIGFVQTWQLSVQRDLPAALQMTVVYLGTKGSRLPQEYLPNTYPTGSVDPSGFVYYTSGGNSNRQAGQVQLRRRLRNGLTASAQYTYAKAIDDVPLMAGGQVVTAGGGTSIAQNWLDLKGERGLSNFDQRHQLTVSGQYTTGVGRSGAFLTGWKSTLFKEWMVTPSMTIGSGLPQTPVYIAAVGDTGFTGTLRPDLTGASINAAPAGYFVNPAAYRAPAAGQWGNAGRNTITGPKQFSLNAGITRTFRMNDRWNMDLTMNATNVLNHVTYASWVATLGSPQFGLPTRANGMRTVQTSVRVRF